MKNLFSIGEIASIFEETTETFRHYDRVGLLKPYLVKENGYRYYSLDQFEMISTILHLRSIGTSIDQIIELLHSRSRKAITDELRHQKNQLHKEIDRLRRLEVQAVRLLDRFESFDTNFMGVSEEPIFYILKQDFADENMAVDYGLITSVHDNIESEWLKYGNIVSIIGYDDLLKHQYHRYTSYGILSEQPCNRKNDFYHEMPARQYVIGYTRIESYDHHEIDGLYDRLLSYIKKNKLVIDGDCFERNILDLYNEESQGDIHYIKVYIPVKTGKRL